MTYDFGHSTVCQVLLRPDRIGWVTGQDGDISQIMVNPTQVLNHHCHPVLEKLYLLGKKGYVTARYRSTAMAMVQYTLPISPM